MGCASIARATLTRRRRRESRYSAPKASTSAILKFRSRATSRPRTVALAVRVNSTCTWWAMAKSSGSVLERRATKVGRSKRAVRTLQQDKREAREAMTNRREFLKGVAGASAGTFFLRRGLTAEPPQVPERAVASKHAPVIVAGKKIKTVDVHCHVNIPAPDFLKGTALERGRGGVGTEDRVIDAAR